MPTSNRLNNLDLRYDLLEVIDENKVVEQTNVFSAADKVAPPVVVDVADGHIPVKKAGNGDRIINGDRAENGSFPRFDWVMGTDSFYTSIGGWEIPIDDISDYEVRRFIQLEQENAQILYNTRAVGKENRVSTAVNTYASYASANKQTITLAADNMITGKNLLNMGVTAAGALYTKYGCEVEQLSLILGTVAIRNILTNLSDLLDSMQYTSPLQTLSMDIRLKILRDYLGVKEIIPVSGRYNASHTKKDASFGRLWSQTQAVYALLSPGGKWDKSFMRQPSFTKPLGGREFVFDTYDEPNTKKSITRLIESKGLKTDYTMGYCVEGIFATGT